MGAEPTTALMRKAYQRWAPVYDIVYDKLTEPAARAVVRAVEACGPRFPGHAQPRLPAWGRYDDRDPAAVGRRLRLAADHGVDALGGHEVLGPQDRPRVLDEEPESAVQVVLDFREERER